MVLFSQNLSHRNNTRKQLLTSLINTAIDFNDTRRFASEVSIGQNNILPFSRAVDGMRLNRRGPLGIIASLANISLADPVLR